MDNKFKKKHLWTNKKQTKHIILKWISRQAKIYYQLSVTFPQVGKTSVGDISLLLCSISVVLFGRYLKSTILKWLVSQLVSISSHWIIKLIMLVRIVDTYVWLFTKLKYVSWRCVVCFLMVNAVKKSNFENPSQSTDKILWCIEEILDRSMKTKPSQTWNFVNLFSLKKKVFNLESTNLTDRIYLLAQFFQNFHWFFLKFLKFLNFSTTYLMYFVFL